MIKEAGVFWDRIVTRMHETCRAFRETKRRYGYGVGINWLQLFQVSCVLSTLQTLLSLAGAAIVCAYQWAMLLSDNVAA